MSSEPHSSRRASTLNTKPSFSLECPSVLYLVFQKKSGDASNRTLGFKSKFNGRPYYTNGKDAHLYYAEYSPFEVTEAIWIISRRPPSDRKDREPESIRAKCPHADPKCTFAPLDGWENVEGRFGHVTVIVSDKRPADWAESYDNKVQRFLAALGKDEEKGSFINVRDILTHLDVVEETLPELISEFPKIDMDGDGRISLEDLDTYFNPKAKKEYSRAELDEIWRIMSRVSEPFDQISLRDMAMQMKFVDKRMPELIDAFMEIDTDKSCSIDKNEFYAFFGDTDLWLDTRLSCIIGLTALKEQIRRFYWSVKLDRLRRKAGNFVNQSEAIVLMFKGHPGVGKTTMGRLIAQLLYKIELIPTDNFFEVQRDQLVGSHIGETEKKTEELIAKATGGVLFVDEAYRLNVKDSDKDFGKEAINALMKAMTVKGKVIVLAGYPKEMDEFCSVNPGIKRRITYEFIFDNYTEEDLAQILELQVKNRGFQIAPSLTTSGLAHLVHTGTTPEQRATMNGGLCEHIARNAIIALNDEEIPRIQAAGDSPADPSIELDERHIAAGCRKVPGAPGTGSRASVAMSRGIPGFQTPDSATTTEQAPGDGPKAYAGKSFGSSFFAQRNATYGERRMPASAKMIMRSGSPHELRCNLQSISTVQSISRASVSVGPRVACAWSAEPTC